MHLRKSVGGFLLCTIFILCFLFSVLPGHAEIYRWQDEQGVWHYTDTPTSDLETQHPPQPSYETQDSKPSKPASASTGQTQAADRHPADAETIQGGFLWRVSKDGVKDSYLLGTIHSSDSRVVQLKPPVQKALDGADRFVMEMEMDASALLTLGSGMMLTDGKDLEAILGPSLFKRAAAAMTAYGYPEMSVRMLKPWVVMAMLSMPKPTASPILDLVLHQKATAAGKPTAGLETAAEQLAVFETLSMDDQIKLLEMTLEQLPTLPRLMDQLTAAYVADDLQQIAALASEYSQRGDIDALKQFSLRLNDDRNIRMAQRMTPYLQQGNSFIAVGALHLAGPAGLIQLLRNQGYHVASVQ